MLSPLGRCSAIMSAICLLWSVATLVAAPSMAGGDERSRPSAHSESEPTSARAEQFELGALEARAGELNMELLSSRWLRSTFAGLRIVSRAPFALEVYATKPASPAIGAAVRRHDLAEVTTVRRVARSLAALRAQQIGLRESASFRNITSGIDLERNAVRLMPTGDQLAKIGGRLGVPNGVVITVVDAPAAPAVGGAETSGSSTSFAAGAARGRVTVVGGSHLSTCTGGFVVVKSNTGRRGLSTAGHCRDTQSALRPRWHSLNFKAETYGTSFDFQWHAHPQVRFPARFWVGGDRYRRVLNKDHADQQVTGQQVCKYGKTTERGCGIIEDTSFCPSYVPSCDGTFILVANEDGADLSSDGDSGGPVFRLGAVAMGIISGSLDDDKLIYMPQSYLSFRALRVAIHQG